MSNNRNNKAADQKSAASKMPSMGNEIVPEIALEVPEVESFDEVYKPSEDEIKLSEKSAADLIIDDLQIPKSDDEVNEVIKDLGFSSPELLNKPFSPQLPKPEKSAIIKSLQEQIDNGQEVWVESLVDGGDYPSRVRRNAGDKFKLNAGVDFSFNWMKLTDKPKA